MIATIRRSLGRPASDGVFAGDIQGNILLGYNHPVGAALFVGFGSAGAARALLRASLGEITSARRWETKPASTLNVAFTHSGLAALGLPASVLASFPAAFREGMAARAQRLGDIGRSAPAAWEPAFGTGRVHALFDIQAENAIELARVVDRLRDRFEGHAAIIRSAQRSGRLPHRKEHFGYTDGVGQPAMQGTVDPRAGQGHLDAFHHWHGLPLGEIFHGRIDVDGHPAPGPDEPFLLDGTFLVWRKLHEEVAPFRRWIAEQSARVGLTDEQLMAKLVGRWPDGSPLALAPDEPDPAVASDPERVNAFDYSDDPEGLRCPLGAHIRRANPRLGLGFGDALAVRQRIIRRGVPYGPALDAGAPDDGVDRGIFFAAYMADIERQFEFIQSNWCNDGDAVNVGHDPDPFIGRPIGDAKFTIPGSPPKFVHPLAELVVMRGGEYLWVPSMRSLGLLAAPVPGGATGPRTDPAARRATVARTGTGAPVRERVYGRTLGALLAPVAFTLSFVRGHALVHPFGTVFEAEVIVAPDPMRCLAGTVFGAPGTHDAIVRLSRGFALPKRLRDVRGLAIRIPDAGGPGSPQDLLMATARTKPSGKDAALRTPRFAGMYSSMLRMASPHGLVTLQAVASQPMPDDEGVRAGAACGLSFDILAAGVGEVAQCVARVTLGPVVDLADTTTLAFNVANDAGGITTSGALNVARTIVYRASHAGRRTRRRMHGRMHRRMHGRTPSAPSTREAS